MYSPQMENKMMKQIIENKSSVALHGLKAGGQLDIEVDKAGTPIDKHWRRRLRDKSIQIIKPETKKEIKKNKEVS
jgi:hypothetical protein